MLSRHFVRSLTASLVILAASACDGGPLGDDPGLLRGSWATRPQNSYLAPTPSGPQEVHRLQGFTFGADGRYSFGIYLTDARNDQWLGEVYREEGTYTVIGPRARLVVRSVAAHTGPYAWGGPLAPVPVEPTVRFANFTVTADRLDFFAACNDVVAMDCAPAEPYYRVPDGIP